MEKLELQNEILKEAVMNLMKIINFMELDRDFQNELITEKEFEEEIKENENLYVIKTNFKTDWEIEAINKIAKDFDDFWKKGIDKEIVFGVAYTQSL